MRGRQVVINQNLIFQRWKLHSKNHMASSGPLHFSFQPQVKCSLHSAHRGTRTAHTSLDSYPCSQGVINVCIYLVSTSSPKVKMTSHSTMFILNIFIPQNWKLISLVAAEKLLTFISSMSYSSLAFDMPPIPRGHHYISGDRCLWAPFSLSVALGTPWLFPSFQTIPYLVSGATSPSAFLCALFSHCLSPPFRRSTYNVLDLQLIPTLCTNSPFLLHPLSFWKEPEPRSSSQHPMCLQQNVFSQTSKRQLHTNTHIQLNQTSG